MTKRRESRSGRNQVIWDQAPHWGKKKKIGKRSERRGRSGEGKGWRFFSFPRPPFGSVRSPICFLFDPVFYLLSPLLETKRERGGSLPSLFPSHDSLASFSCSLFFVCDRKNRELTKLWLSWFKGTEMGTSYCSPYLKLNIFRSNPGSRIHPSRPWLLFSKQYLFNSLFLLKPLFNEVEWSLRCIQLVGRPKRTFRFLKCVQVVNKNAGTSFKASLGQIIKTIPM